MSIMHEDRTIKGKNYRVALDPISTCNPEGSKVAVFVRHQGKFVRVGDETIARPGQTDADLLKQVWQEAEHHASTS